MKTGLTDPSHRTAAIVRLAGADAVGEGEGHDPGHGSAPGPADAESTLLGRARAFAEPLLAGQRLPSGESATDHAEAVAAILQSIGAAPLLRAAVWLVHAGDVLTHPEDVIGQAFGASLAGLVQSVRKLVQLQRNAREAQHPSVLNPSALNLSAQNLSAQSPSAQNPLAQFSSAQRSAQAERVRKMLLAFSRDLRVVLLRLTSRLQTLRWHAASRTPCPPELAAESLHVFAPLANRLGIWQIKWELEDLAFRFLDPAAYTRVAGLLDERRIEREQRVEAFRGRLEAALAASGLRTEVQGRPKHLYSIWKKMHGKHLDFDRVFDLRAVRVVTEGVAACYAVLGRVHELYRPVAGEFDDYIERPKPNGYQSLHTVVEDEAGRPVEVQIRTRAMHEHAEHGVAAHWAYKDAGVKGYAGASADAVQGARIAEARKAVLRELLAWERDVAADGGPGASPAAEAPEPRIYVFTPQAAVVELTAGATPVDFAYSVHTDLGHRCRGARVDGRVVPLHTRLSSGQTVDIISAKEGGPSLDWLNADLGILQSPRARAKVRAWFNVLARNATIARGREAVEKLLQREGRTAIRLDELGARLGFRNADALFEVVGKDELSLRTIEALLRPAEALPTPDEVIALRRTNVDAPGPKGGVLVVGVESLMTHLARCCRPAPPDAIGGYVTRGKGVAVHRSGCTDFRGMAARAPERVIAVAWGSPRGDRTRLYPVDLVVEARDRQGLLRDISELFARESMNVTGVRTRSVKDSGGGTAWMAFTIEVADAGRLAHVLGLAARIDGVRSVRRK